MAINASALASAIKTALDTALGGASGSQDSSRSSLASAIATPVANAHNSDGVSSTVSVQDEGSAQGAAGTFNFVGAGVTAAVAGGVATITIAGGGSAVAFADNVIPTGSINGSNATFTLPQSPTSGSLHLYLNGVRLRPTTDYSISGATITMVAAPATGDWLYADYRY